MRSPTIPENRVLATRFCGLVPEDTPSAVGVRRLGPELGS
jgi:hypothetical protein